MAFHVPLWRVAATDPDLKFERATAALPKGQPEALPHRTVETGLERVSLRSEAGEGVIAVLRESSASGEPISSPPSAWAVAARRDALEAGDLEWCFASAWLASADVAGRADG